jgi:hypothetical protein
MLKTIEIDLEYMNYIPAPPRKREELYHQACSNDGITVESWRKIWVNNARENHKLYGPFKNRAIGKLWGKYERQPGICEGSGPSLCENISFLKDTKGIPVISCLHNYHYNEDNGVHPEYYVTLDAGEITIKEISEGGQKSHDEYIESTKDKTLLAYIGSPPALLKQWKGDIIFFNCPIPDPNVINELDALEPFHNYVSTGGNVLGACVYIAKAIFGCNPICYVGADFSFSYNKKFHSWNSGYDNNLGEAMRGIDVFGNKRLTWRSYYNFKCFFDWLAETIPGIYINATEGGILGAYPEGNLQSIIQMRLEEFVRMYSLHHDLKEEMQKPEMQTNKLLY